MPTRWIIWPMVVSLVVHALVVGSVPAGDVVLCLGGESHEAHEGHSVQAAAPVETACASGCGHHQELPVPTLQTPHAQECSCVDVVIAPLDLRFRTTTSEDRAPERELATAALLQTPPATLAGRAPRIAARAALPPPDPTLAALRTIRLQT